MQDKLIIPYLAAEIKTLNVTTMNTKPKLTLPTTEEFFGTVKTITDAYRDKMDKPTYSKGNWSVGKSPMTVVTDYGYGFPQNTGHDDKEHYGGYLIAESIWKQADAKLIAASKDLLEACIKAEKHHQGMHYEIGDILRAAIKKATT